MKKAKRCDEPGEWAPVGMFSLCMTIKPQDEVPEKPSFQDFAGIAHRLTFNSTGDAETDKKMLNGLVNVIMRHMYEFRCEDGKVYFGEGRP